LESYQEFGTLYCQNIWGEIWQARRVVFKALSEKYRDDGMDSDLGIYNSLNDTFRVYDRYH
jgi:hypothetical protein